MTEQHVHKRISKLEKQLANLIKRGRVVAVDVENYRCKVNLEGWLTGWLPWLTHRAGGNKTWHGPEVGEQVVVFSPNGNPTQGIVTLSLYQDDYKPPANSLDIDRTTYKDGAAFTYDRASSTYSLNIPARGKFLLTVGASTFEITNAGWKVTTPDIDMQVGG